MSEGEPAGYLRVSSITGQVTGIFLPGQDVELRSETLQPLISEERYHQLLSEARLLAKLEMELMEIQDELGKDKDIVSEVRRLKTQNYTLFAREALYRERIRKLENQNEYRC